MYVSCRGNSGSTVFHLKELEGVNSRSKSKTHITGEKRTFQKEQFEVQASGLNSRSTFIILVRIGPAPHRVSRALRARNPGRVRKESRKSPPGWEPPASRKSAPRSLRRVRKSGFGLFSDSFETPGRTLSGLWRPRPGDSFGTLFGLFRGSRARRARETLCGAGPILIFWLILKRDRALTLNVDWALTQEVCPKETSFTDVSDGQSQSCNENRKASPNRKFSDPILTSRCHLLSLRRCRAELGVISFFWHGKF